MPAFPAGLLASFIYSGGSRDLSFWMLCRRVQATPLTWVLLSSEPSVARNRHAECGAKTLKSGQCCETHNHL
ncbi:hypothetical protein ACRRTK_020875 [Alexandromys fortis]